MQLLAERITGSFVKLPVRTSQKKSVLGRYIEIHRGYPVGQWSGRIGDI
jgi:hypothetical protein